MPCASFKSICFCLHECRLVYIAFSFFKVISFYWTKPFRFWGEVFFWCNSGSKVLNNNSVNIFYPSRQSYFCVSHSFCYYSHFSKFNFETVALDFHNRLKELEDEIVIFSSITLKAANRVVITLIDLCLNSYKATYIINLVCICFLFHVDLKARNHCNGDSKLLQ